jgi:hypothetical protein
MDVDVEGTPLPPIGLRTVLRRYNNVVMIDARLEDEAKPQ